MVTALHEEAELIGLLYTVLCSHTEKLNCKDAGGNGNFFHTGARKLASILMSTACALGALAPSGHGKHYTTPSL